MAKKKVQEGKQEHVDTFIKQPEILGSITFYLQAEIKIFFHGCSFIWKENIFPKIFKCYLDIQNIIPTCDNLFSFI